MSNRSARSVARVALVWWTFACAAACGQQQQDGRLGARVAAHADPLEWTEAEKLLAGDGAYEDWFGGSVAISGGFAVVGAPGAGPGIEGAAYVYARGDDGAWIEAQRLTPSDGGSEDLNFGNAVAIRDDVAFVGAPYAGADQEGAVYVFERTASGQWLEEQKLTGSGASNEVNDFGGSLAVSGELLVVGAPGSSSGDTEAAYVFERNSAGQWLEGQRLTPNDGSVGNFFGRSVAISGNVLVVGTWSIGMLSEQSAYLFERDGDGTWLPQERLTAIDNQSDDWFGSSVAISGDTVVVGARGVGSAGEQARGAVYLFERDGGSWNQAQKLVASDGEAGDSLGSSVALSGDLLVVGSPYGGPVDDGAVYIVERNPPATGSWSELRQLTASDGDGGEAFGTALAMTDGAIVVGASSATGDGGIEVGAAYLFELRGSDGDPCPTEYECLSGHCIDDVCCESDCGGGETGDCMACSVAAGSTTDGSCEPVPDGATCSDGACHGGVCEPLDLGMPCSTDARCASEHCVDEVCCDEPSCAPYRCQADTGQCGALCQSDLECVAGFRCTSEGLCAEEPPAADDGGCGCRSARTGTDERWAALTLLGLALALTRRRRLTAAPLWQRCQPRPQRQRRPLPRDSRSRHRRRPMSARMKSRGPSRPS